MACSKEQCHRRARDTAQPWISGGQGFESRTRPRASVMVTTGQSDPGSPEDFFERSQGEAAGFALALLPFLEGCLADAPLLRGIGLREIKLLPRGFEATSDFGLFWRHDFDTVFDVVDMVFPFIGCLCLR